MKAGVARIARRRFAATRSDERAETQPIRPSNGLCFHPFIRAGHRRRSRPACDAVERSSADSANSGILRYSSSSRCLCASVVNVFVIFVAFVVPAA
jgi:hypothetical protein